MPANSACAFPKIRRNISAARRCSAAGPCAARAATWPSPIIPTTCTSRSRWRARCRMSKEGRSARAVARGRGPRQRRGLLRDLRASQILGPRRPRQGAAGDPRRGRRALHKAAELGHPFSTQMLAILLDRGETVKRDPVAARYWAERAVANPAKDASRATAGAARPPAGHIRQTGGARPRSRHPRASGKAEVFGAKRELAIAIRKDDPVRARALLEESRGPTPAAPSCRWRKC